MINFFLLHPDLDQDNLILTSWGKSGTYHQIWIQNYLGFIESDRTYILGIYFNMILISRWTVRNAKHHDATTLLLHQPNKTTSALDIWIQYSRRDITY